MSKPIKQKNKHVIRYWALKFIKVNLDKKQSMELTY